MVNGTISRCGLVRISVSLWRQSFEVLSAQATFNEMHTQSPDAIGLRCKSLSSPNTMSACTLHVSVRLDVSLNYRTPPK